MNEKIWIDWLHRRGITDAVIADFGLSFGPHPVMGSAIVLPVHLPDGSFSFNKYRRDPMQGDVKPKYVYDKGSKSALFGADKIGSASRVLVTEGELDALVAWSLNIPAVSSTGGASTFQEDWVCLLEGREVVLCFDNDVAGGAGMMRVLKLLPSAQVMFLPDRPGVKDISDYVGGGGDLNELLRSARRFENMQEVIDDRSVRLSLWQSVFFHDAYIEEHRVPVYVRTEPIARSDGDDISRAKTYPIGKMLKFDKGGKALCIWHSEKTPSLHYFKKNNTVYCFGGCGKRGDAIDVYQKLHGASFGEAVRALI